MGSADGRERNAPSGLNCCLGRGPSGLAACRRGRCRTRVGAERDVAAAVETLPLRRQSLKPRLLTAEGTLDGGRRSTTWGCPARVCARRSRSPTFGEKPIDSRPALLVDLPQAQEETEPAPLTRVRGDADDRRRADPGHGSSQRRRRVPFSQPTASGCLDTWATRCVSGCISAISLVSFVRIAGSNSPTSATSIMNAPAPPITQSW
jgi:hypothetical protein